MEKVHTHKLDDGSEVQSFRTTLKSLGTIVSYTCYINTADESVTFEVHTAPIANQQHAFDLLKQIKM